MSDVAERLKKYMTIRIPYVGFAILKKQCVDLGLDIDNIDESDIPALAERLGKASEMFLGAEKSRQMASRIKRMEF